MFRAERDRLIRAVMKLTSPSSVRTVLAELDVHPSKALGQNFLIDQNILDIIVASASIGPGDSVLEIGAGLGVLTERLVQLADRVMAVELDKRLLSYVSDRLSSVGNLELVHGDARDLDYDQIVESGFRKVVANLPYSVGSRVLMDIAMTRKPVDHVVVTVQLEVAKRIIAQEGTGDYGLLSVWTQLMYDVALRKTVVGTCFWPCPSVDSAVVVMRRKPGTDMSCGDRDLFCRLTKYAFSQRRKQLKTILRNAPPGLRVTPGEAEALLDRMGVDSKVRPSDLSVEQWCELTNMLTAHT